jgi:hypothetical protein
MQKNYNITEEEIGKKTIKLNNGWNVADARNMSSKIEIVRGLL